MGVHRGLVYLDTAQDDVYGLAANLAARVSGLAPAGDGGGLGGGRAADTRLPSSWRPARRLR